MRRMIVHRITLVYTKKIFKLEPELIINWSLRHNLIISLSNHKKLLILNIKVTFSVKK